MPQAPSPVPTGWVAPPARSAWTSRRVHAVTASSSPLRPYRGISLLSNQAAMAGCEAVLRATSATNHACWETSHTSRYRSRPASPSRVPVLARHVPDDEGRDGPEPCLAVELEEVDEPLHNLVVQGVGLGHEIRPIAERAREGAAVCRQDLELFLDDVAVVTGPHSGAAGTRPEVRPDPNLWAWWPNLRPRQLIARRVAFLCSGPLSARPPWQGGRGQ